MVLGCNPVFFLFFFLFFFCLVATHWLAYVASEAAGLRLGL